MPEQNVTLVSVLLADDAEVMRKAVANLLATEPRIRVVAVAKTFGETIELAASVKSDVLLLDLHMPDSYRFPASFVKSQLAVSGAKVLAMSLSSDELEDENRALAESFGAMTLLDKGEFGNILIPAILRVGEPH
jgi:two-component system, chemotaxis family, protein-glutamate methylesterase/glutaminase